MEEFSHYLLGIWNEVFINILNNKVALSIFVTTYACKKLYDKALKKPLGCLILYFDADYVVYLSPTGEHLINPDMACAMGLWTSKTNVNNWFMENFQVCRFYDI